MQASSSFIAIGAGFVVGTTIRTAIIFASVPRRLPATAAALNQVSITVGTELGLVIATSVVAQVAMSTFAASISTRDPSEQVALIARFQDALNAIGTSAIGPLVAEATAEGQALGGAAYAAGVSTSMAIAGAAALVGAVVCWFGIGRRERLAAIYDLRDERVPAHGLP